MNDQPENIDELRLQLMRSHASGGYYNRRDIVEATASAVIRSRALHILLDRYSPDKPANGSAGKSKKNPKLDEIRQKIDRGFYDDPNNLAELVERLIKKLNF